MFPTNLLPFWQQIDATLSTNHLSVSPSSTVTLGLKKLNNLNTAA